MTARSLCMIGASALATVAANLLLRAGVLRAGGFRPTATTFISQFKSLALQPMFLCGGFLYALAALIWFHVISTEELSSSYPLLVSTTFVLVTAGAVFFFQEHISLPKMLGIALILGGIIIVSRT